ncbi:MAG TPA: hypothetical protein VLQ89_07355, partial [Candidatus Binatia bacterium]|nr:hypothetical protein [Candidatus Binatia bacterium]
EAEERIFRTVRLIQDEFDYFQGQANAILKTSLLLGKVLPVKAFAGLHPALARHLAREYLRLLKGNLLGVDFEHIAGFLAGLESGQGLSLPGVNLKFSKGWIYPEAFRVGDYSLEIAAAGRWPIAAIGRAITLKRVGRFRMPKDNFEILVQEKKLHFPLLARPARRTDKYRKIHSPYRQHVHEMIRSSGLPVPLRSLAPLLENGDGTIIWVCGSPLADAFAVEDRDAGPFVRISIIP